VIEKSLKDNSEPIIPESTEIGIPKNNRNI